MTNHSQGWMAEDGKGVQKWVGSQDHIDGSRRLEISGGQVTTTEYERGNSHCVPFHEDTSFRRI
jgi:hypothetical protein